MDRSRYVLYTALHTHSSFDCSRYQTSCWLCILLLLSSVLHRFSSIRSSNGKCLLSNHSYLLTHCSYKTLAHCSHLLSVIFLVMKRNVKILLHNSFLLHDPLKIAWFDRRGFVWTIGMWCGYITFCKVILRTVQSLIYTHKWKLAEFFFTLIWSYFMPEINDCSFCKLFCLV